MTGHTGTAAQPRLAMLAAAANTGHAATVHHNLIHKLAGLDGPTGPRTLHARADFAERATGLIHHPAGGKADPNG